MYDVSRELAELRLEGERLARAEDHQGLLAISEQLRTDQELWPFLWAPSVAIAAAREGRPGAAAILQEAIEAGFNQPELFEGQLEDCFADGPAWAEITSAMAEVPRKPWELLEWPTIAPGVVLAYDVIPSGRSEELRARLPEPDPSSWATTRAVLAWTHRQWQHANDHVKEQDALVVLDRAAAGENFACVEYSIVLSQALNAVGIPARRVQLFQADRHVGVGRGHVVSEAWVDELARWVLLDGQNAAWWADESGPLGVLDLVARHEQGARRPTMTSEVEKIDEDSADAWWTYFADAQTTGFGWGDPFNAVFQGTMIARADTLLHDPQHAYPDLDQVGVGIGGSRVSPHLVLHTNHPHAIGFSADGIELGMDEPQLPIDLTTPGEQVVEIRVRTAYGTGRAHLVRHMVRP